MSSDRSSIESALHIKVLKLEATNRKLVAALTMIRDQSYPYDVQRILAASAIESNEAGAQ